MWWFAKKEEPAAVLTEDDTFNALRREPFDHVRKQIFVLHSLVNHVEGSRALCFRENECEYKKWRVLRLVGYRAVYRHQHIDYDPALRHQLSEALGRYGWTLEEYAAQEYKELLVAYPPTNPYDMSFWSIIISIISSVVGITGLLYKVTGELGMSAIIGLVVFLVVMNRINA